MTEPWNYYQTFVFLDIESTGLPRDQPCIAELCLFAVHQSSLQPSPQTKELQLPRIIDKLILCINPQKPFTVGAQIITGLSNQELEQNCKPEINRSLMETLKGFLDRQAHPICLVAHNGLRFDFPLLRKELLQIGTDLPSDTGCLDTLQALKDVLREPNLSYNLGNLYQYFYGEEPSRAHTAEGDVLTLLLVFLAKANVLKHWATYGAQKWGEIKPMDFHHSNRF
ncbi:three prime repair exonuclease 2 [Pantherophis guttatus]|uniref:exodeoxyribonuclease III n=1 Tax=Pantherophis guttatus TaxID=94885 RepID=A0A6P9D2M8_PANGU|nr:three prime repair exonuclease 2 [Pantherophis guttatus]